MTATFYQIEDDRGIAVGTWDTDRAARLSRAGLHVTATTVGER